MTKEEIWALPREEIVREEIVRLARLGLKHEELKGAEDLYLDTKIAQWAKEHAIPALNEYRFISVTKGETQYSAAAEALARLPKEAQ